MQHAVVVNTPSSYAHVPVVPHPDCHARWIWREADSGGYGAPPGTETFATTFDVPPGYVVQEACLEFSADDRATAKINGAPIGTHIGTTGLTGGADERTTILNISSSLFHVGTNELQVEVQDEHDVYSAGIWCLKVCLGKCTACVDPPNGLVAWWPFNHCNQEWQDSHRDDWTETAKSCDESVSSQSHPVSANGVRAGAIDVGDTTVGMSSYTFKQNVAVVQHHHDLDFTQNESFTIDCWI